MTTKFFRYLSIALIGAFLLTACGGTSTAQAPATADTAQATTTVAATSTPTFALTPGVIPTCAGVNDPGICLKATGTGPNVELQILIATATPGCGFGPIAEGTLMHQAKHVNGALYQLTGGLKLAKDGEYCESGLPYNIDDASGQFLGAYSYGFVQGEVENEPSDIWIVGHEVSCQYTGDLEAGDLKVSIVGEDLKVEYKDGSGYWLVNPQNALIDAVVFDPHSSPQTVDFYNCGQGNWYANFPK